MISRKILDLFLKSVSSFPVVVVTGARQVGKSTLCKEALKKTHAYISLEDPDIRSRALDDPKSFLKTHQAPLIIDEIQYAPKLVNFIQTLVDEDRKNYGQYVLTGSQNFLVMEQVSQSLAGRAMLLDLYALSSEEIGATPPIEPEELAEFILRGHYPELAARPELDRNLWVSSYTRLYLERDVRQLLNVDDLNLFERFIKLVAIQTGQILNQSRLASDTGVSVPTIKRWLSLLESSYQIYLLPSYQINLKKRLTKAPKIYFCDTALASYLMGFHDTKTLLASPQLGALFETVVIMDCVKKSSFVHDNTSLSYFRTHDGLEVDLVREYPDFYMLDEIKLNRTINPHWKKMFEKIKPLLKKKTQSRILSPIDKPIALSDSISVEPWWKV